MVECIYIYEDTAKRSEQTEVKWELMYEKERDILLK